MVESRTTYNEFDPIWFIAFLSILPKTIDNSLQYLSGIQIQNIYLQHSPNDYQKTHKFTDNHENVKVTRRKTKTDTQKVKQKDKKHVDDGITYIYKYAAYLGK